MANSFIHNPAFGLIIILVALAVAAIAIHISNKNLEAKRRAEARAPLSRPGLQRGGVRLQHGDNWQAVCPDCGAFLSFPKAAFGCIALQAPHHKSLSVSARRSIWKLLTIEVLRDGLAL